MLNPCALPAKGSLKIPTAIAIDNPPTMPSPIHCPQCHSTSHRHIHGNHHQCNYCGSTFIIPNTPPPEPPPTKLKDILIFLAILLAAACLLELMAAA